MTDRPATVPPGVKAVGPAVLEALRGYLSTGDRLLRRIGFALIGHGEGAPTSSPLRAHPRRHGVSPTAQPKGEEQQHAAEE